MKGTEASIYVDEYCFDVATSQVEVAIEVGEAECTNLASTAQEFVPLLGGKVTVTQNGYFDGVLDDGFEAELNARFGVAGAIVTVLTQKSDPDCVAYVLPDAAGYDMTFSAPVANLVTLNGKWGTSDAGLRGLRIFGEAEITATGEQTAVDFAAGTTTGGTAILHVTAIDGTASDATIDVESSADDNTYASEGTITLSDVGGYRLALSGTVGRYVRLNCTDLGGATGITCMAVVALN